MGKFKNKQEYDAWKKGHRTESPAPAEHDGIQDFPLNTPKKKTSSAREFYTIGAVIVGLLVLLAILSRSGVSDTFVITLFFLWLPVGGLIYLYVRKSNREKLNAVADIICPNTNCNYKGKPTKIPRANIALGIILCFFFLVPGILYFIIKSGYRYTYPRCGIQLRSDV